MIVIEGPDGSGKTTLAKVFVKHGLEYRRPPKEILSSDEGPQGERGLIEWWLKELSECRNNKEYRLSGVYDRTTFISDPIYRLAHGGKPQGHPAEMGWGVSYLANYADAIIFCLPDFGITLAQVNKEGRAKLKLTEEQLYNIWYAYFVDYYKWSELAFEHVILHDWTSRSVVVERALALIGKEG